MAANLPPKNETIGKHRLHESDTGSPEVQIALLTDRIDHLTEHLKVHKKDCPNALALQSNFGYRIVTARWMISKFDESM